MQPCWQSAGGRLKRGGSVCASEHCCRLSSHGCPVSMWHTCCWCGYAPAAHTIWPCTAVHGHEAQAGFSQPRFVAAPGQGASCRVRCRPVSGSLLTLKVMLKRCNTHCIDKRKQDGASCAKVLPCQLCSRVNALRVRARTCTRSHSVWARHTATHRGDKWHLDLYVRAAPWAVGAAGTRPHAPAWRLERGGGGGVPTARRSAARRRLQGR
jgi:hypothetical protein